MSRPFIYLFIYLFIIRNVCTVVGASGEYIMEWLVQTSQSILYMYVFFSRTCMALYFYYC